MISVADLPRLNALLNTCAALFLVFGRMAIKRQDRARHKAMMMTALLFSALFLISYIYYHYHVTAITRYQGEGFLRLLYFLILITHVILATGIVPFVLASVWYAFRGQFERHTRVTRILWPVWMYVSVSGVAVYLMLYVF